MDGGRSRARDGQAGRRGYTARPTRARAHTHTRCPTRASKLACARTSGSARAGQRWQICASLLSSASASVVSGQRPTALLTSGSLTCTCAMAAARTSIRVAGRTIARPFWGKGMWQTRNFGHLYSE